MRGEDGSGTVRGAGDEVAGRRTLLLGSIAAVVVLAAMAAIAGSLAPPGGGTTPRPPAWESQLLTGRSGAASEIEASRALGARQRRFWIAQTPGRLSAANAVQGIGFSFTRGVVGVKSHRGAVALDLTAIGRGATLVPLPPAPQPLSPAASGVRRNRLSFSQGAVQEWYANGPLGLEQGLALRTRPMPGARSPLTLAYQVTGASRVSMSAEAANFFDAHGAPLMSYGALSVTDATGRMLPSRLAPAASGLLIQIDDAGARYPLHVDPLIQGPNPMSSVHFLGLSPAALAPSSSTAVTLSIAPLNAKGKAFGTADEGVDQPLKAEVTITNPPSAFDTASAVKPAIPLTVTPNNALKATGAPAPPIPSGGYTLAPGSSASFVVPYKIAKAGPATISDSVTWQYPNNVSAGPSTGMVTANLGSRVSGTVFNFACGDTSCKRSGLKGQTMAAEGRASDGTAIARSIKTAANGGYSIGVPAGTYKVGASQDGKTVDGPGFDPTDRTPVVVPAAAPATGQDFSTCGLDHALGTASDRAGVAASTPVASAAVSLAPSPCKSIYTIQVSAKIPQSKLVDPSTKAPYEVHGGGGYNPATPPKWSLSYGFPVCFSPPKVAAYTQAKARAEWYTYIEGGKLGSVKVALAWNRHTQEVHLVDGPSTTYHKLTRVFVWRMKIHGKTLHGRCSETNEVPMLVLPAGGADIGSGALTARQFSLITVWGLPFEPSGVQIDPSTFAAATSKFARFLYGGVQLYDHAIETIAKHLPFYHSLNKPGRQAYEFGASYLLGSGALKALRAAPAAITGFVKAAKYLPQVIAAVEEAAHVGHQLHNLNSYRELVGFAAAYADKGEYPVIGAVIRGRFQISGYAKDGGPELIPLDSMLGLSVKSAKLATISVKVSRQAEPHFGPSNPVTNGLLPWTSRFSAQLDVFNRRDSNPAYVINNGAGHHVGIGLHGVHQVHTLTSQTPVLTDAVERHQEEGTDFDAEASEAATPGCGAFTAIPDFGSFLCYKFNDGRP